MILQALVQHYEDLLAAGEVVRPGWARAKVSYGLDLSGDGRLLGLLMEADLLVNCYEDPPSPERLEKLAPLFRTETGRRLLAAYRRGRSPRREE